MGELPVATIDPIARSLFVLQLCPACFLPIDVRFEILLTLASVNHFSGESTVVVGQWVERLRVLDFTARLRQATKPWYHLNMALIEIEDQIAKALRAQADIRDMTLEAFLQRIAEMAAPINPTSEFSVDEFDRSIAEVSSETPVLPDGFSRADLYADHD